MTKAIKWPDIYSHVSERVMMDVARVKNTDDRMLIDHAHNQVNIGDFPQTGTVEDFLHFETETLNAPLAETLTHRGRKDPVFEAEVRHAQARTFAYIREELHKQGIEVPPSTVVPTWVEQPSLLTIEKTL